jgi:hypothetical protein
VERSSEPHATRRRIVALTVGVAALLFLTAPPAAAHSTSNNYVTAITSVEPPVPGLHVSAKSDGSYLTIENQTGEAVVVLGYQNEPYLRLTEQGVWQNTRSLTTYVNADVVGDIPADVDPQATPVWQQISTEGSYRFHDHRVDWNGSGRPAVVDEDPGADHLIANWTIGLRVGDTPVTVNGTLSWKPSSGIPGMGVVLAIIGVMLFAAFIFAIVLDARRSRDDDDDDVGKVAYSPERSTPG